MSFSPQKEPGVFKRARGPAQISLMYSGWGSLPPPPWVNAHGHRWGRLPPTPAMSHPHTPVLSPAPTLVRPPPKRPDANLLWGLRTGPLSPARPCSQSSGPRPAPGPPPPASRSLRPSGHPRRRPHPAAYAAGELMQTQPPQVLLHRGAHCPARRFHGRAAATPCPVARQPPGRARRRGRPAIPRLPGGAHFFPPRFARPRRSPSPSPRRPGFSLPASSVLAAVKQGNGPGPPTAGLPSVSMSPPKDPRRKVLVIISPI